MKQEYGGYFEMELNKGREFHPKALALNTGRNCLRYLIQAYQIQSIWLPSWLCDAIIQPCILEKVRIQYYSIDRRTLKPVFLDRIKETDWVYVINYFGLLSDEEILLYAKTYPNLILDNVQAFFRQRIPSIDTLYTCRKFFGVTDGAYLYTDKDYRVDLTTDVSNGRMRFLAGRFEQGGSSFFEAFQESEASFEHEPMKWMSEATHNILRGIDYDAVIEQRTRNFDYLRSNLSEVNQLQLPSIEGAFIFPLLHDKGYWLKRELIKKKVYVPTIWPNCAYDEYFDSIASSLSRNVVPLPCDQRYTTADMQHICSVLFSCLENLGLQDLRIS